MQKAKKFQADSLIFRRVMGTNMSNHWYYIYVTEGKTIDSIDSVSGIGNSLTVL